MSSINNSAPILFVGGGTTFQAASIVNDGGLAIYNGEATFTGNTINNGAIRIILDGAPGIGEFSNLTNNQLINVATGQEMIVTGELAQLNGTTEIEGTLLLSNAMELEGGSLAGAGTIQGSVSNTGGSVSGFGSDSDTNALLTGLTITGNYTQAGGGIMDVNIFDAADFGLSTNEVSFLDVVGNVDLSGTLEITAESSFLSQLALGTSFDILDFGTLSGEFTNFDFDTYDTSAMPAGFTWDLIQNGHQLDIVWSTAPDCSAVAQAILSGTPVGTCSNLPPNGTIPSDFNTPYTGVTATYGPTTFVPTTIELTAPATPEPGTIFLLLGGAGIIFLWRKKCEPRP
jgi:hypothetical protein